LNIHL